MDNTEELYKNSKFSGWTDYGTSRKLNTNSQFINDAAATIYHLENSNRFKRFINTYSKYITHINQTDLEAHDLTIEQITPILEHLYLRYREIGKSGSIEEMTEALFTTVDTITNAEALKGLDDTKAVSAPKFHNHFVQHARSPRSHRGMITSFLPKGVVNIPPSISYINLYKDKYTRYQEPEESNNTYTFPLENRTAWNPTHGTVYLTLNATTSTEEVRVFTISTTTADSYICYYQNNTIGITKFNTQTGDYYLLDSVDLELIDTAKRRFVFGYSPDRLLFRAILKPTIQLSGGFGIPAKTLTCHLPFYEDISPESPSIVRWVYYPTYIDDEDKLSALLS